MSESFISTVIGSKSGGSGHIRIRGASAHPAGGVAEMKAISFGDYGAKLLEGVLTWDYVRVPIESL